MPSVPKPHTYRSEKYKAFIRTHPCPCGSSAPNHAHHARVGVNDGGGKGIKISDLRCVPRCFICHDDEHNAKGTSKEDLTQEMVLLLSEYIELFGEKL